MLGYPPNTTGTSGVQVNLVGLPTQHYGYQCCTSKVSGVTVVVSPPSPPPPDTADLVVQVVSVVLPIRHCGYACYTGKMVNPDWKEKKKRFRPL